MEKKLCDLSRKKMLALVVLVVLGQLLCITIIFSKMKNGFYCDEMYSYGAANSGGVLSPLDDIDEQNKYLNKWFDGKRIRDFIVLDKSEIFRYDLVNKALEIDGHPPLHFYLVHLFSSFVTGRFTKWTGFVLNAIAFFVLMLYVYRLALIISKCRFRALLITFFFGYTTGAVNIVTFSRMYCLLCMLTVIFSFYSFRVLTSKDDVKAEKKNTLLSGLFMFLTAMTQYQGIVYGFFITLFVCIYLLVRNKIRSMFRYGFAMLFSVALIVAVFPIVLKQLSEPQSPVDNSTNFPFIYQLRLSINHIFGELFGISTPAHPTMFFFWFFWSCVMVFVIGIMMLFLFRKEEKTRIFIGHLKTLSLRIISKVKNLPDEFVIYMILLIATINTLILSSRFLQIYYYFPYSDRYLFILYPFAVILILIPVFKLIRRNELMVILCLILLFMSVKGHRAYYLNYVPQVYPMVEEKSKGADVVIVGLDSTVILNMTSGIMDCNQCFVLTKYDYKKHLHELESLKDKESTIILIMESSPVISVLEKNTPEEIMEDIKKLSITENYQYLGTIGTAEVYQLR